MQYTGTTSTTNGMALKEGKMMAGFWHTITSA